MRGDDGAGIEIARQLKGLIAQDGVEFEEVHGDGAELMSAWHGFESVYIFDAVMSHGEPGRVHRLDANEQSIPSDFFKYSSHAFSVAEAIEMGKVIGTLPKRVIVYGVEGSAFGHGEPISDAVQKGIALAVSRVLAELLGDAARD